MDQKPFRTFPEIEQPEGLYIFRAQKTSSVIQLGLFENNTNDWKLETINKIRQYFINAKLPCIIL